MAVEVFVILKTLFKTKLEKICLGPENPLQLKDSLSYFGQNFNFCEMMKELQE